MSPLLSTGFSSAAQVVLDDLHLATERSEAFFPALAASRLPPDAAQGRGGEELGYSKRATLKTYRSTLKHGKHDLKHLEIQQ